MVTAVSPIAQPNNNIAAMLDIGKYVIGSKENQSSTTTGDTAALQQLLAGMNPEALQALVQNLFGQAAEQVPVLSAQYANATGSRVSNNSMLSQSLAQVNTTLAAAIANAVVQQQGQAVQAAGKIADSNKTQTQTKETGPGKPGRALATTVAGFGLNKIGKSQDAEKAKGAMDASPVPVNMDNATFPSGPIGSGIPQVGDLGAFNEGAQEIGNAIQTFANFDTGIDPLDFTGGEIGTAASIANNAASVDLGGFDFGGWEDFGFFKDGGRVGGRSSMRPGYADGGVVRNKPNFGPTQQMQTTHVAQPAPVAGKRRTGAGTSVDSGEGVGDSSGAVGGTAPNNVSVATAIANMSPFTVASIAANPSSLFMQIAIQTVKEALFGVPATTTTVLSQTPAQMPPAVSVDPNNPANPVAPMPPAVVDTEAFNVDTSFDAPDPAGAPAGADSGGGDGTGPSGPGDGAAPGDAYEDGGRVASKGKSPGGVTNVDGRKPAISKSATPAKKKQEGDGRFIRGGADASGAVDITAHIDEYVLPASTVDALGGAEVLDALVAATHTPTSGGTHG